MRRVEESRSRGVEKKTARRPDGETASRDGAGVARGSTHWRLDEPELVEIRPDPSPAERAAILAALRQVLARSSDDAKAALPAWAAAGRGEAVLGRQGDHRTGWERDRLADW